MKVTELKLGDIVKCGEKVVKVTALGNTGVCISNFKNTSESWVNYINLTPIPLTNEILEKNGWNSEYFHYIKEINACNKLQIADYDEGYYELLLFDLHRNGYSLPNIKYVHQLQHILWALGIDDNFKV